MSKNAPPLEAGDRFQYWNEIATFVEWVGLPRRTAFGTYRHASVINADKRLVVWTIDQDAVVPCR